MRRLAVCLLLGGVSGALIAPALAGPVGGTAAIGDQSGLRLLEQAASSGQRLSWHGTQYVSFWSEDGSTSALVEVSHVAGEGSVLSVAPTPGNEGSRVFHGEETAAATDATGFSPTTLQLLTKKYELVVEGPARVAGRQADIVAVRRRGASPLLRFWLDRDTRLVLRRESFDTDGRTLSSSAYIDIDIGTVLPTTPTAGLTTMPSASGAPVNLAEVAVLREEGWRIPSSMPGGLDLYDARRSSTEDGEVLHLSYSDGVSSISLFEQRGRLETDELDGWAKTKFGGHSVWARDEFPRRVVWSGAGFVYTVVAECQRTLLDEIVSSLPHTKKKRGMLSRLTHGLSRVAGWLNPFD